jgi:hypothetical protein
MTTTIEYFASGSNHAGEIRGLAEVGHHIGLVADRVGHLELAELDRLAGSDVRVFVDSGAFSEVDFPGGVPTIVKPITDEMWRRRLATYATMAMTLGPQLCVVAPDCVAHQDITLERLERYAAAVELVAELGAQILVPIQKGAMSMGDFARRVETILDCDWTPSVPMKKDATTAAELEAFVADYRPARVHLLGLGPKAKRDGYAVALAAVARGCSTTTVQSDSNLLKSLMGRTNGPGGGPRIGTRMLDQAREDLAEMTFRGCYDAGSMGVADYTDEIGDVDGWLTGANRRKAEAELAALGYDGGDLAAWLEEHGNDWTDAILDEAWGRWFNKEGCVAERKRRQVIGSLAQ